MPYSLDTAQQHYPLYGYSGHVGISGNARIHFGSTFDISVPTVVSGEPEEFRSVLAEPTIVIPFTWLGQRANIIIGLT